MHWVPISPIAHGIDAYARGCNPNGLDRRRRRSIFAARAFHLACGDSLRLGLRPKHDTWGHDGPQSREYRRIPDTWLVRGSAIALYSNIVRPPVAPKTFGWRALSARSIFCRAARRPGSRRRSRPSISTRGMKKVRTAAREPRSSGLCPCNPFGAQPYLVCSPSIFCAPTPRSWASPSN